MAQHDYNIEDQNGFDFLVDLNNALSAIVTNNAGSFEPNPTFAHMLWFDKNNDLMKVRNEANSAWVIVAKKDGSGWTPYRQGTALGTASVQPDTRYAHRSNNLSDLGSATTARANLGLGSAALMVDSANADLAVDPNAAARRGLVAAAIAATQEGPYVGLAANLVAGGLGSLVFAYSTGGDVAFGGTVAGSALRPVGAARSVDGTGASNLYVGLESGSSLTGTWTCLGYFDSAETNTSGGGQPDPITIQGATLWQRTL